MFFQEEEVSKMGEMGITDNVIISHYDISFDPLSLEQLEEWETQGELTLISIPFSICR